CRQECLTCILTCTQHMHADVLNLNYILCTKSVRLKYTFAHPPPNTTTTPHHTTHTHTQTHTITYAHTHTYKHTQIRIDIRQNTWPSTHTYALSPSLPLSLSLSLSLSISAENAC